MYPVKNMIHVSDQKASYENLTGNDDDPFWLETCSLYLT